MRAPLDILQEYVAQQDENTKLRITSDKPVFHFNFLYPQNLPGFEKNPHTIEVSWDDSEQLLKVKAIAKDLRFKPWDGMEEFYKAVDRDLQLFVHSYFYIGDGYAAPALGLWFEIANGKAHPSFETLVGIDPDEDEERAFVSTFNQLIGLVCQSLWVCRPVFSYVSVTGQEPNAAQRMELLIKSHGTGEVLREEEVDEENTLPPHISFPDGLFGGAIAKLRPQ